LIGRKLGHYQIVEKIGAGGMGVVYKARDLHLERFAALKILPPEMVASPDRKLRFVQEAKAASALNHPNIITIYDISQEGGIDFIAMEYVEGETLAQMIAGKSLPLNDALAYAVQIAEAIAKAHAVGIVHRDLKPGNIMITHAGLVKVLDFGLAKLAESPQNGASGLTRSMEPSTDAGTVLGTVAYMSPEQAEGRKVDARSDIFSLGSLLYEMMTGRSAFVGGTSISILDAILHKDPIPPVRLNPDCPPGLELIIHKALEKDRELRYQTAFDLAADLKRLKRDFESGPSGGTRPERQALAFGPHRRTRSKGSKGVDQLAVLPFENTSADPDMEYLSDGITESLINNLSQLPRLQVMARSTVFRFKGQTDPVAAARQLNVRAVLTGKVMQHRDTLIVSVELVDAGSGSQLWGERYQRKVADIFEVQDTISREITNRLQVRLTSEQKKRLAKRPTVNMEAYQLYLKGRYFGNQWTAEGYRKSIEYFRRALQADPDYALAYAGLADAYSSLTSVELVGLSPMEQVPRAKEAALKALQLDDSLAEAHTSLAEVKLSYEWDWAAAEQEFRKAVELNPSSTNAYHRYSHLLVALGRMDESLTVSLRALELDPLDAEMGVHLAWHYYNARQYDKSIEACRATIAVDPNFHEIYWFLGLACEAKTMYEDATAALQKALELSGGSTVELAALGHVYGQAGEKVKAEHILDELVKLSQKQHVSGLNFALVYTGLGKTDSAIACLEKGCQERANWMPYIGVDPRFDALRHEPRFQDLLRKMNLPC
jgi:serine/threonine protein kinase/tetratricopeptide (TPR) repeat protein